MPFLVAAFGRVILWCMATMAGNLILGLGVGVIAYSGMSALVSQLHSLINQALGTADPAFLGALDYAGFYQALDIILSAYIARFGTTTAYKFALKRASS